MNTYGEGSKPFSPGCDEAYYRSCLHEDASRLFKGIERSEIDLVYTTNESNGEYVVAGWDI